MVAAWVSDEVLPPPRQRCLTQPTRRPVLIQIPPTSRLPAGGKAVNTAPVPGQTPHDESDRRTEPRSSVSDLVNSLTSEMLMVRRAGCRGTRQELDWEAGAGEGRV